MNVLEPKGKDIAELLLLCAPKEALNTLELSEENKNEFSDNFNISPIYIQSETTALALYYANRSIIKYKKSNDIVRKLYISPEVVHSLIMLTETEESSETENIFTGIEKSRRSQIGRKAVQHRHNQPGGSNDKRKKLVAIWESGQYKTKSACAMAECEKLGMSYDTAKKALITPKKQAFT